MSDSVIICPDYVRLVERKPGGWLIKKGRWFHKQVPISVDFDDIELLYGISEQQLAVELFRVNGGKAGFYLADLRNKQYYYCGTLPADVKPALFKLGIGRADPQES